MLNIVNARSSYLNSPNTTYLNRTISANNDFAGVSHLFIEMPVLHNYYSSKCLKKYGAKHRPCKGTRNQFSNINMLCVENLWSANFALISFFIFGCYTFGKILLDDVHDLLPIIIIKWG